MGQFVTPPSDEVLAALREYVTGESPSERLAQSIKRLEANVEHPRHYTDGPTHSVCGEPIECIDITEPMGFCLGNAQKYLWRAGKKTEDPVEDLKKAVWYIQREIARLEAER